MKNGFLEYFQKIKLFDREAKLFLLIVFLFNLLNGGYQVIFNLYLDSLGYQSDFIGTIASVRLIIGAFLGIPLGIMATRIGYRKTLILLGLMISISVFGVANTNSKYLLFIFSILWGNTFVLMGIITAPFLARNSNIEERNHLFGFTFSLQLWSSMLGSFIGGSLTTGLQTLFTIQNSYRYTFNLYALIAILSLIPIYLLRSDRGTNENSKRILHDVLKIAKYSPIRRFILYSVLIGLGAGLVIPLFNIFLRLRLGASDFQIGLLMSFTRIATSVGCLLTPYLVKLFGQSRSVLASQLLSIPFLLIIGGIPYFPVVAIAYFLRTSLMNMVNPIVESVSMQVVGEDERSAASSLIRTFRTFGRGTGVYLSGILLTSGSYLIPFILTCLLYLIGSLVFYFSFRKNPNLISASSKIRNVDQLSFNRPRG